MAIRLIACAKSQHRVSTHILDRFQSAEHFETVLSSTVPDSRPSAGNRVEKGVWNFGGIRRHEKNLMPESSRHLFQHIRVSRIRDKIECGIAMIHRNIFEVITSAT